ncbi:MAG: hypothetical protein Q8P66_01270 [Candidatus Colwellbacteria bacterium]|nr:hypothetical protein [Candidatus Colwellbacteria bacterium]
MDERHEVVIRTVYREFEKFRDVSGLDRPREHFDGTAMTYQRGVWHGAVKTLYAAANLEAPTDDLDLLGFGRALSNYVSDWLSDD